eukprot:scaffold6446_cov104-Isochrysis_galbana.AAC.21
MCGRCEEPAVWPGLAVVSEGEAGVQMRYLQRHLVVNRRSGRQYRRASVVGHAQRLQCETDVQRQQPRRDGARRRRSHRQRPGALGPVLLLFLLAALIRRTGHSRQLVWAAGCRFSHHQLDHWDGQPQLLPLRRRRGRQRSITRHQPSLARGEHGRRRHPGLNANLGQTKRGRRQYRDAEPTD